jgi:hypothetical protein
LDFTSPLGVQKEEKLTYSSDHIERIEWLCQVHKLRESRHQLEDVVLKILLFKVTIATRVVQTDLNACLEQVDFPDYIVEERHDLHSTEFIPFKFEESTCGEELTALWR